VSKVRMEFVDLRVLEMGGGDADVVLEVGAQVVERGDAPRRRFQVGWCLQGSTGALKVDFQP